MKSKLISTEKIPALIKNGAKISVVGFTLMGASETILKKIEDSFLTTSQPNNLTLIHCAGQSDRINGIQHLAHPGLVKKIIGSHWGLAPKWGELIFTNQVEAQCLPQGQMTHLFRAMASGKPGIFSKVGLGTFIDPRVEGGFMNEVSKQGESLVECISIKGEEYLFYNEIPIDVAIIRGTTADEFGNITMEDEAIKLEALAVAQSAKRFGGKVVVQVKNIAKQGSLHPKAVVIPGIFVDAIVIAENAETDHRLTASYFYNPAFTGDIKTPVEASEKLPLTVRKVIARRGAKVLYPDAVVNLGTGIPGDAIGPVAKEEGILSDIHLTVESGVIGGIPEGGIDFGIAKNAEAIIEHPAIFDYYNGAGVDVTFMGLAEADVNGNVNVSKFGGKAVGCGGFIDITQPAKMVVFLGTFTTGGLEVAIQNGKLKIIQEGKYLKFKDEVQQISFSGKFAQNLNQKVLYVTERAVFQLTSNGVELIEIAPGIDLEKDILELMAFEPVISDNLKIMDMELFFEEPMNLQKSFYKQEILVN